MSRKAIRKLFDLWETLFHVALHLEDIEPGVEHLFYISKRMYFGRSFTVDGVTVRTFDPVIELHFNNDMVEGALRADPNVVRAMIQLLRQARQTMPVLAGAIQSPRYRKAKALYGITFIHRGIDRFGFHTLPLSNGVTKRITTWHLTNILRMLNPDADHILETHREVLEPKLVVASKEHIIEQFGRVFDSESSSVADVMLESKDEKYTVQS